MRIKHISKMPLKTRSRRLVVAKGMQQRKLRCHLLCLLAAAACCAAAKEQRKLDDGGIPLDVGYREHGDYPSPRCCVAGSCATLKTGQHAFVASVRTARYVPLLKQLVCSLAESNPGEQGLLKLGFY
jgi:hypothetical protein